MLLKHGASAVVQSKVDEITLGILSKKTGEAITLDELLLKDGNTFITAFTTAFVMNSGKAIIVELKGQKYELKPEDLENCIDEYGNFDSEKLEKYLYSKKKNVLLSSSDYDISDSLNNATVAYKKYLYNKGYEEYMPGTIQLEEKINKIKVYSDSEFENILIRQGEDPNIAKHVPGFTQNGVVYLRENVSAQVVVHELTHSLGSVHGTTKSEISSKGINEAMTDTIANEIVGEVGLSVYKNNAEAIADINERLISIVGEDLLKESYFSSNKSAFKTAINAIMADDNFYDSLAEQMNISIDGNSTYQQIQNANNKIDTMVSQFLYKTK